MREKLKVSSLDEVMLASQYDLKTYSLTQYFKVHKFLGAGGFGFVIAAEDHNSKELIAVKVSTIEPIYTNRISHV